MATNLVKQVVEEGFSAAAFKCGSYSYKESPSHNDKYPEQFTQN